MLMFFKRCQIARVPFFGILGRCGVTVHESDSQGLTLTLHSRSDGTVGNWVGNQLPAGWDTHLEWGYFGQFLAVAYPESKNPVGYQHYKRWAGDWAGVFGSPSKATDAGVDVIF